jgi:hypothetical protein
MKTSKMTRAARISTKQNSSDAVGFEIFVSQPRQFRWIMIRSYFSAGNAIWGEGLGTEGSQKNCIGPWIIGGPPLGLTSLP